MAKLALQVLAVFGIAPDEDGPGSYWAALRETLGREIVERGKMPHDLDAETHQENWSELRHWANTLNAGRRGHLAQPNPGPGRRHVKLPYAHGLLREEDIRGLHRFFLAIGASPGEEIEPADIVPWLLQFADNSSVFHSRHARLVLQDDRVHLASRQIAHAAAQWDGRKVDLARESSPVTRLWLIVRGGCPVHIAGGLVEIDPNRCTRDVPGADLNWLFGRREVRPFAGYRPLDPRCVVLVRSLLDGRFVEARHARPGDEVVVALPGGRPGFASELRAIATPNSFADLTTGAIGVPTGWTLYRLRVRDRIREADLPAELRKRVKLGGVRLRVAGGLRVRGPWMEGAGPTISIVDGDSSAVVVDGSEYDLVENALHPDRCPVLGRLGVHEVWLPGRHRDRVRFRVVRPNAVRFARPDVEAGWVRDASGEWPRRLGAADGDAVATVRGPVLVGVWPPARAAARFLPAARAAVRLAVALKRPEVGHLGISVLKSETINHPNLLVRQLARAVRTVREPSGE